jgi:ribosomal protein L32
MNYVIFVGLMRCPACGYYAFNGIECFDCGYRTDGR